MRRRNNIVREPMSFEGKLLKDLKALHLDKKSIGDYELVLKKFSVSFYGRYVASSHKAVVYVYRDVECKHQREYSGLLSSVIHELTHHIQHTDPKYIRRKGVMHNKNFWFIYNSYIEKAKEMFKSRKEEWVGNK